MSSPPIALTPSQYIETRIKQYQGWYNKRAVQYKNRHLYMRAFTVIGGGVVPVLINVETGINSFAGYPIVKPVVTLVSLLVVVMVSLESVFHYREQWRNYRSTEQALSHELFQFQTKVGPYKGLTDDDAFQAFVERSENAIVSENAATLNVMTIGSDSAADKTKQ